MYSCIPPTFPPRPVEPPGFEPAILATSTKPPTPSAHLLGYSSSSSSCLAPSALFFLLPLIFLIFLFPSICVYSLFLVHSHRVRLFHNRYCFPLLLLDSTTHAHRHPHARLFPTSLSVRGLVSFATEFRGLWRSAL